MNKFIFVCLNKLIYKMKKRDLTYDFAYYCGFYTCKSFHIFKRWAGTCLCALSCCEGYCEGCRDEEKTEH
jgi:hypothetical protein